MLVEQKRSVAPATLRLVRLVRAAFVGFAPASARRGEGSLCATYAVQQALDKRAASFPRANKRFVSHLC